MAKVSNLLYENLKHLLFLPHHPIFDKNISHALASRALDLRLNHISRLWLYASHDSSHASARAACAPQVLPIALADLLRDKRYWFVDARLVE